MKYIPFYGSVEVEGNLLGVGASSRNFVDPSMRIIDIVHVDKARCLPEQSHAMKGDPSVRLNFSLPETVGGDEVLFPVKLEFESVPFVRGARKVDRLVIEVDVAVDSNATRATVAGLRGLVPPPISKTPASLSTSVAMENQRRLTE